MSTSSSHEPLTKLGKPTRPRGAHHSGTGAGAFAWGAATFCLGLLLGLLPLSTLTAQPLAERDSSAGPASDLPALHVPAPRDLPAEQILDPERRAPGSLAFGRTNDGRLLNGRTLPLESTSYFVLREHRARGTNHTSDALASIVEDAAAHLHSRFPDTRLSLGNLSAPDGGRFRWSRSHQNGLDGDIGFVFVDHQTGEVVEAPTLYHVRPDLSVRQRRDLRFDPARNWALVEGLLQSDAAEVQWIFISEPLKAALLMHARESGADPEMIRRASIVLHQPGDSLPHDDHFHLRIACPPRDAIEGCVHWGPRRDWWPRHDQRRALRVDALLDALAEGEGDRLIADAARTFLIAMEPRDQATVIAMGLSRVSSEHRPPLLHLLRTLDQAGIAEGVLRMTRYEPDPSTRALALQTLGRVGDESAAPALVDILSDRGEDTEVRIAAARALRTLHPGLPAFSRVPDELAEAESEGNHRLAEAMDRLLRRQSGLRAPEEVRASHFWGWTLPLHLAAPEPSLRVFALREAGYVLSPLLAEQTSPAEVRTLMEALQDERDEVSYSAHRLLRHHAGVWSPLDPGSAQSRSRWWERRLPARLLEDMPQASLAPR